ncbi:hypothetical protein RI367_005018 [Sorochytrium milnesiophthora]
MSDGNTTTSTTTTTSGEGGNRAVLPVWFVLMILYYSIPAMLLRRYRKHTVLRRRYPLLLVMRSLSGIWLTTNFFRTGFPVVNAAYQDLGTAFFYVEMVLDNIFLPFWLLITQLRAVLGLYEFRTTMALLQSSWRAEVVNNGPSQLELVFFRILSGALADENYRWHFSVASQKSSSLDHQHDTDVKRTGLPSPKYIGPTVTSGRLIRLQVVNVVVWVLISVISIILFLNVPGLDIRSPKPWRLLPLYVCLFLFQLTMVFFWVAIRHMWSDTVYIRRELIACLINFNVLWIVHVIFLFSPTLAAKALGPQVGIDVFMLFIFFDCQMLLTVTPLVMVWYRERQRKRVAALYQASPERRGSSPSTVSEGSSGTSLLRVGSQTRSIGTSSSRSGLVDSRASSLSMASMVNVICDPEHWAEFKQVIARDYCTENALFVEQMMALRAMLHGRASIDTRSSNLDACAVFNAAPLPAEVNDLIAYENGFMDMDADIRTRVLTIYEHFIEVGSPCELNIPCPLRQELRYRVRGGETSPEILEPVLDEVLRMLYFNSFPRYVRMYTRQDSPV